MDLQVGSTVGDYEVVGTLGAGGMGKVYKVRNVISDRIEAMKVLLPDLANEADLADRFLREIKVQASLVHPNIASLHTAVRVDNQLLMLMEFLEGVTLDQKLKDGPQPVAEAVDYIMQALSALDYAHAHGVIHRDIKPANMMLTSGGVVKLMDFGIAKAAADRKLTMTGTTMGSLYYMSPEQIQGAATLDARSDLYSVGVSLYELVTGKRPFDGDSQFAIMSAHLEKTPVPPISIDPKLPQMLNDIIVMSVARDPGARFQTGAAFRNALGNVDAGKPATVAVQAPVPAKDGFHIIEPTQPAKPHGKRGLWMGLGALAALLALIAAIEIGPEKGTRAAPQVNARPAQVNAPPTASTPVPTPEAPPATPLLTAPAPNVPQPALESSSPAGGSAVKPARAAARTPSRPAERPAASQAQPQAQSPQPQQPSIPATPQTAPQALPVQTTPAGQSAAANTASRAELQQAREQLVMLGARAGGIRASLDTLQRSQAASGLNLRGDMQEASSLMGTYLDGANAALNDGNAGQAKSFMDKAERQIEKLEKFLNR